MKLKKQSIKKKTKKQLELAYQNHNLNYETGIIL